MAVSWTCGIILTLCLLGLVVAQDAKISEFKMMKKELFGETHDTYTGLRLEEFIKRMIALIENGDIPAELQGMYNLEYLKSLDNDCQVGGCTRDEVMTKMQHLNKSLPITENSKSYQTHCRFRLIHQCSDNIYDHVKQTLKLDDKTYHIVDTLADQVKYAFRPIGKIRRPPQDVFTGYDFHKIVLSALRVLDPVESKRISKKWTNKGQALREYMDTIRLACDATLKSIDSVVELYPEIHLNYKTNSSYMQLQNLHYILRTCRTVVADWEGIVTRSREDHAKYLIES